MTRSAYVVHIVEECRLVLVDSHFLHTYTCLVFTETNFFFCVFSSFQRYMVRNCSQRIEGKGLDLSCTAFQILMGNIWRKNIINPHVWIHHRNKNRSLKKWVQTSVVMATLTYICHNLCCSSFLGIGCHDNVTLICYFCCTPFRKPILFSSL